jgi:hypothetical protein
MAAFVTLEFRMRKGRKAYERIIASATSQPTVSPRSRGRTTLSQPSAAISRASNTHGQSLKLTVKAAPSKLREVMRANEVESLQDTLGGGQVIDGPRRRRNQPPSRVSARAADRPKYADYGDSDADEDEESDDPEQDDEEDDDMGADEDVDDEDDAAGEEDVEMEDVLHVPTPPVAPKITLKPPSKAPSKQINPRLVVTPANVGSLKSVEDQEMQDDPGDEEVADSSELSEDEDEDQDGDETNLNDDAPGEEDEIAVDAAGDDEELDEDDDGDDDSDDSDTPGSGAATPDLSKMTKRQRKANEEFMALEMGPQQRKVGLTTPAALAWLTCTVLHGRGEGNEEGRACPQTKGVDQAQDSGGENSCVESPCEYTTPSTLYNLLTYSAQTSSLQSARRRSQARNPPHARAAGRRCICQRRRRNRARQPLVYSLDQHQGRHQAGCA